MTTFPLTLWDGSAAANALIADKGMTDQRELHAWFVRRVAEIADARGVKIAGWQEVALDHSDEYDSAVRPSVAAVNCWTATGDNGSRIARKRLSADTQ